MFTESWVEISFTVRKSYGNINIVSKYLQWNMNRAMHLLSTYQIIYSIDWIGIFDTKNILRQCFSFNLYLHHCALSICIFQLSTFSRFTLWFSLFSPFLSTLICITWFDNVNRECFSEEFTWAVNFRALWHPI